MTSTPRGGLMQTGQVAERTGLSLRTIRFHEENGLMIPTARSEGGFRLYSAKEVARLEVIKRMKPLGSSLEEMQELLTLLVDLDSGAGDRAQPVDPLRMFHEAATARVTALRAARRRRGLRRDPRRPPRRPALTGPRSNSAVTTGPRPLGVPVAAFREARRRTGPHRPREGHRAVRARAGSRGHGAAHLREGVDSNTPPGHGTPGLQDPEPTE